MTDTNVTRDEFVTLVEKVESLENELEAERERRQKLEKENQELQDRVDELEKDTQVLDSRADALFEAKENIRKRLDNGDLAEHTEQESETPDVVETETPLEDVVGLPEDVVDSQLTQNQQRARFLAKDIADYGEKAMAGRVLKAGRVGRVLRAGLDVEPHPETVRRVMEILADLADDEGTLRKRAGEKRVVVEDSLVDRLERIADEPHNVVRRETA